jgi:leader peptidase (prepilin peptidase)/N-methyltransferase
MPGSSIVNDLSSVELANLRIMAALTAVWFVALGASLGSFLNVIVYRVPLGRSLWRQPSACPNCGTPIRLGDNIPIFGWIKVGARCRSCRWPIPIRYPLVELAVALQFLILLFATVVSGGESLPYRTPDHYAGVVWTVWYAKYPDLLQIYGFHLLGLYLLLAVCLMGFDGRRIPQAFISVSLGLLLGYAFLFPAVYPQDQLILTPAGFTWNDRFTTLGCGLGGWLVGGFFAATQVSGAISRTVPCLRSGWIFAFGIFGIIFGWQAALTMAIAALPLWWILAAASLVSGQNLMRGMLLILPLMATLFAVWWRDVDAFVSRQLESGFWIYLWSAAFLSLLTSRLPVPPMKHLIAADEIDEHVTHSLTSSALPQATLIEPHVPSTDGPSN